MRWLAALLLLCVVGCDKAAEKVSEKAVETATGTKVDKSGEKVTVKTKEGTLTYQADDKSAEFKGPEGSLKMAEGEVPKGFPLPVYKGAKVLQGVTHERPDEGKMYQVTLQTPDAVGKIADFYAKALKDKGIEAERRELKSDEMAMVALTSESDKLQVTVTATRQAKDDKATVSLAWHAKK